MNNHLPAMIPVAAREGARGVHVLMGTHCNVHTLNGLLFDPAPDGIGCLAVSHLLHELGHGDQRQAAWAFGRQSAEM